MGTVYAAPKRVFVYAGQCILVFLGIVIVWASSWAFYGL